MARYVHLVFSDPPPGVSDDEYDAWYDEHVKEILSVDGWVSATRYRVDGVVGAGEQRGLPLPVSLRARPPARGGGRQPRRQRDGRRRRPTPPTSPTTTPLPVPELVRRRAVRIVELLTARRQLEPDLTTT